MLTELRISNFALVDRLDLQFSSGFHVLTGETGAGKSIIVDAIALLVGGRASADQIRSDAEEAVLEAAFALSDTSPLTTRLREAGILGSQDTDVIVRRVLSRTGRHRLYLNGGMAPLHLLQSLAGTLVDIHGQHEQQSLLSTQAQLDVLDAYGQLKDLRTEYLRQYEQWRASERELDETTQAVAERRRQEDLLRFQCHELEQAALQPGEEEELSADRHKLSHRQRLVEASDTAYAGLYEGDATVLGALDTVRQQLRVLSGIDREAAEWAVVCDTAVVQLRELAAWLRDYRDRLGHEPERLTQIEDRLDVIQRLKKKYGATVEQLCLLAEDLRRQIEGLDTAETRLADLQRRLDEERAKAGHLAGRLSQGRKRAASRLEKRVQDELAALRMDRTRFQVALDSGRDGADLGPTGCDRIEYLFSANEGEPLQPLARVASGGELSRVMLAMKSVLAETDHVPILIFDEVDAGVGGAVAAVMGKRLRALADYHQVFCITHLPQIAAQAEAHYLVEKGVVKKRTVTQVRRLDQKARKDEVARMLGGLAITKAMRDTAADMIDEAQNPS